MSIRRLVRGKVGVAARLSVACIALAASGTVIAFSGTGLAAASAKPKTVTLQFWNTYNTADKEASTMAKVIIPKFEKMNPGIKVDSVQIPYGDLLQKFITSSAAGIAGPPTTINQMFADAATLTVPSKQQYGLGVDGTDIWNMAPYIWSMGGSFTNANYTQASGYMDSNATETAVTALVNLLNAGDIGSDFQGGASAVSGEAGFPKGEYAMYIDGPWAVPTYSALSPVPSYGIAPFPSGAGGSISTVGGEDTVVAKDGHHIADAEKFAEFLDSPFAQLAMAAQGDMSTEINDAAKEVAATPYYSVFTHQLLTARIRANSAGYSEMDSDWSNELGQILAGKVTVDAGLASAAQEGDQALAGS
jgi:multiple sugar transport system substrate-binding protein